MNGNRTPPGPADAYDTGTPLIVWLQEKFDQYGDFFSASIYGTNAYVVSAPQYLEHVLLKNWQNYVKGQAIKRIALLLGKGLMVSEGEFWISQRRMVQPAFHRGVISALADDIAAGNRGLCAEWEQAARDNSQVNVTRDLSRTVLQVVLRSIFGEDYEQAATHFNILSGQPERSLQFADAFRPLSEVVIGIARQRRDAQRSCGDLLGLLMQARNRAAGEAMPDRQLAREIMTLVVAGHETTASVLNWTWYLLSQHPAVADKLGRELEEVAPDELPAVEDLPKFAYTRQILDEAMRLYPPGWLMTRKALKDDQLGDHFVPAGTEIYIAPYLVHRHPEHWNEPERFDPDRFEPAHVQLRHPLAMLPFSAGPRNCIGEHFARIEMQIHLMLIASRLSLKFAASEPPEMIAGVNLLSRDDFIMTPHLKIPQPLRATGQGANIPA